MFARKLLIYVDTSVVGGCEDARFRDDSLARWERFRTGHDTLVLSEHTLRELANAPQAVRNRITEIPRENQVLLPGHNRYANCFRKAYPSSRTRLGFGAFL